MAGMQVCLRGNLLFHRRFIIRVIRGKRVFSMRRRSASSSLRSCSSYVRAACGTAFFTCLFRFVFLDYPFKKIPGNSPYSYAGYFDIPVKRLDIAPENEYNEDVI